MSTAETSFACARAFVDELVRGGVRHASVSPGSRSTPLALAVARHPGVSVHVHLDERSGSFFALGLARALGEAVALVCTSGTAAAEFLPAVVEASQSRVPLIVLTADRPPRLRGTGANQTIDQVGLFGRYARAYVEPPTPTDADDEAAWRRAAAGAIEVSERSDPPGPVHVNCPFDEPLTPRDSPGARGREATAPAGGARAGGTSSTSGEVARAVEAFVDRFDVADGLVVAGTMSPDAAAEVVGMAAALRWPLIAEPTSGAAGVVDGSPVVLTAGLSMIESPGWLHGRRPEVVVQAGAMPTSRAARAVAASARRLVVMDGGALDPDPDGIAAWRLSLPLHEISRGIAAALAAAHDRPDTWLERWRTADRTVRAAIDATMDRWDEPSEMRVARDVAAAVPIRRRDDRAYDRFGATLFVGNSMPVRDLGAYMSPRPRLRVLANRGASGIDGLVSTALGVARSGTGPTVALLGDLSFLYDAGALLWNARRGIDLVVVVNDNGGGQIFAGLGQRELPADELERLFVTPHHIDIEALCGAAGARYTRVERALELIPAIREGCDSGGVGVIHVAIDASRDRARRAELRATVDDALDRPDPR